MPSAKRSRIVRSTSLGEVCMFDQVNPLSASSKWGGKLAEVVHSASISSSSSKLVPKPTILTLGSPITELEKEICAKKIDYNEVGGFLKTCFGCKKTIGAKAEIFMYSYLGAFCSAECREKQIALDVMIEKAARATNSGKIGAPSKWRS